MFSAYLAALTLTCSNLHSPSSFRKHLVGCLLLPRQTTDPKFTLHTCAYTCHNCVMICLSTRIQFSCSVMSNPASPWNAAGQTLSITNSQSLLKLLSIEWVMPSNHLISTIVSFCLQSFPASGYFLPIRWLQVLEFPASASVLPVNIQD